MRLKLSNLITVRQLKNAMLRTYSELSRLETFIDRYNYLKLSGSVGMETFGFKRYLNQLLYKSADWRDARRAVIIRDNGCDLGIPGREIFDEVLIHHMNPITEDDIIQRNPKVFDPEYLICTSFQTHNAIHYGDPSFLVTTEEVERFPNDMAPWLGV